MIIKMINAEPSTSDTWFIILFAFVTILAIVMVALDSILLAFVCLCIMGYSLCQLHWPVDETVHLQDVPIDIEVQGQKVVIPNLPDNYRYDTASGHSRPDNSEHIFKFEYDDIFETGTLTDHEGRQYKLDKDDSKYLRERDGK